MPGAATAARQPGGLLLVSVTTGGGRPVGLAGGSQIFMSAKKYAKRALRYWGSENIPPSPFKRKNRAIPELIMEDMAILSYLSEQPGMVRMQADIAASAGKHGFDRKTVGKRLRVLRDYGLVKRPEGYKRRGNLITTEGMDLLHSIPK